MERSDLELVLAVKQLGSPAAAAKSLQVAPSVVTKRLAALEAQLGLDRPPLQRYLDWTGGLLRGETARSLSYDDPTAALIAEQSFISSSGSTLLSNLDKWSGLAVTSSIIPAFSLGEKVGMANFTLYG